MGVSIYYEGARGLAKGDEGRWWWQPRSYYSHFTNLGLEVSTLCVLCAGPSCGFKE